MLRLMLALVSAFAVASGSALALAGCSNDATAPQVGAPVSPTAAPPTMHVATATATTGPSSDCAKVDNQLRRMVCADPQLAALDRRLADEYQRALARPGVDKDALEGEQDRWVTSRSSCAKHDYLGGCLQDFYQTRLLELHTADPAVATPPTVTYRCPGDKPFTARFYNDFEPRAAVLTWGTTSATVFAEPSASGSKYGRERVEFWEDRGEVTVDFLGNEFVCTTP